MFSSQRKSGAQTNKQTGVEEMLARSAADVRQNKVLLTVNTNL